MRPIKTFAFSALAALVAAAALGAPSAPAETTALCKVAETPCSPGNQLTSIHLQLASPLVIKTSLLTVLCLNVLAKASVLASGNPQVIHSSEFTFANCGTNEAHSNCTISTLELPLFNLLKIAKNLGTLKASNGSVQVKCTFFVECKYSSEGLTLHVASRNGANGHGMVEGKGLPLNAIGGSLCPKTAEIGLLLLEPLEDTYLDAVMESTSLSTSLSGGGKSGETITVPEGTAIKDQATLSGANASKATGTVTYSVYADKECKELVTKAGEVSVSGGSVPASSEVKLTAGAVYYWQAAYSGDEFNGSSVSPCGKEVATVKATTSLATSLSGGGKEGEEITVAEGSKVKDQATISGTKSSTATGTIKYAVYKDKECKELTTKAGEGEVKEGKAPASEEKELEAATVYYWQAEYSGDSLHEASTSTCGKEVLTVKATMSVTTSLSGEEQTGEEIEVQEEAPVHDTASLSGTKASTATGTVTYKIYADEECEELVAEAGEVTVKEGKVPNSEEIKLESGAIYYWQAQYSGDALHAAAASVCGTEREVVAESTSLATTLIVGESEEIKPAEKIEVTKGTTVADTATLSGAKASEATGAVIYSVYADEECTELVATAGTVTVEGEEVPSSPFILLPAGTYYWQAEYFGDISNKGSLSSCGAEVQTVVEPAVTTTLSGEEQSGGEIEVQESAAVTDTAALHGPNASKATGTVSYFVYADEQCEELVAEAGEVTVKEGKVPASEAIKLKAGAVYYWQAEYSGDKENAPGASACGTEVEVVADATSLETSLSGEEQTGEEIEVQEMTPVTDSATLSGPKAASATGSVLYTVFADSKCEDLVTYAGAVEVEGESVPSSDPVKLPAGTYYWRANYSGDSLNKESVSLCGSEIEVVETASLTILLKSEEETGGEIDVEESSAVVGTATLHGESPETATGTVEYAVYADDECTELVDKAGEVTVKGGVIPGSKEEILSGGTYYWQAKYSGDEEHEAAVSICGTAIEMVDDGLVVSVGDSFVSGEGGRWAGNISQNFEPWRVARIDAFRDRPGRAYKSQLNYETGGEAIPGCHRSESAEVFFRLATIGNGFGNNWVDGRNFACSGAETRSKASGNAFTPGLDFLDVLKDRPVISGTNRGTCPIAKCTGQAKLLETFAKDRLAKGQTIKMVVLSIGGNNFGFANVVGACYRAWMQSGRKSCEETEKWRVEPANISVVQGEIETGIERIGEAMENAKYTTAKFTILVQDYPSPIPEPTNNRYPAVPASGPSLRQQVGGCGMRDTDIEWANKKAIPTINKAVKDAVGNMAGRGYNNVIFLELEKVFVGRRLCEKPLKLILDPGGPEIWSETGAQDVAEWINQIRFVTAGSDFEQQESIHPNYWGQLALRNCLRKVYNNGTPLAGKECTIEATGIQPHPNIREWGEEPRMKLS